MVAGDPRIGTVLHGRYKILERLDEGAMAILYRAERVQLGRLVAVKFLHESYAASDDGRRRFQVEARAMSRLSHPNCVAVTDFGVEDGAPYLVMDYVPGRSLRQLLRDQGRLPMPRAIYIVRQLLAGLAHAHAHGIVHRDVKPENVVITDVVGHGEQVRLVDFGLAKLRDEGTITTGVALGTPGYMSPEQTLGTKIDERADIYAIGIIFYELLVGWKPFQADSPFEVMRMHREVAAPPLAHSVPGMQSSPQLEATLARALAKAPQDRFATASDFSRALEATPEARGGRPAIWRRWREHRVLLGSVALVAGISLVAYFAQAPADQPSAAAKVETPANDAGATPEPAAAHEPETAPEPDEEMPASALEDPEDVARIRSYATSDRAVAIRALEELRSRDPDRAEVSYALGNLHAEQQSWRESVDAYREALDLEPGYRSDDRLIDDVVRALGSDEAFEGASELITEELKGASLPRLQKAARSSNPRLRGRAEVLLEELDS